MQVRQLGPNYQELQEGFFFASLKNNEWLFPFISKQRALDDNTKTLFSH